MKDFQCIAASHFEGEGSNRVNVLTPLASHAYVYLFVVDGIILTAHQGPELKEVYDGIIEKCGELGPGAYNGFGAQKAVPYSTLARHIRDNNYYSWRWQHKAGDWSRAVLQRVYVDVKKAYNL